MCFRDIWFGLAVLGVMLAPSTSILCHATAPVAPCSSGAIDMSQFCITSGAAVWLLRADIICLEYDGNVADAALIALIAALRNTKLPVAIVSDDGDVTVHPSDSKGVVMDCSALPLPLSCAVVSLDKTLAPALLCDPTATEETEAGCVITAAVTPSGKVGERGSDCC